jgi:hypothetical protein
MYPKVHEITPRKPHFAARFLQKNIKVFSIDCFTSSAIAFEISGGEVV